jgi:hypothetical protein
MKPQKYYKHLPINAHKIFLYYSPFPIIIIILLLFSELHLLRWLGAGFSPDPWIQFRVTSCELCGRRNLCHCEESIPDFPVFLSQKTYRTFSFCKRGWGVCILQVQKWVQDQLSSLAALLKTPILSYQFVFCEMCNVHH